MELGRTAVGLMGAAKALPRMRMNLDLRALDVEKDIIKENISHYCEATIEHSRLSYQEKEGQKRQMKQSLEVYIQGVKDEMSGMGRMR